MPGPKPGKPVKDVPPVPPEPVLPADTADPGQAAKAKAQQKAAKKGKYGQSKVKAFKPANVENDNLAPIAVSSDEKTKEDEKALAWVGIELLDEAGKPVAGQKFIITLPDGSVKKGSTDAQGKAKVENFATGTCHVELEQVASEAW